MTEEQRKKRNEQTKAWKVAHPSYQREWRKKNPDKIREYALRSAVNNAESRRKSARKYYHSHLDKCKADRKKWRERNPEKIRENSIRWHKKNPNWYKEQNRKIKLKVIEAYGPVCACCGEWRVEFLTADHIKKGGTKHRDTLKKWGSSFLKWLVRNNFPPGYQILCWNCNCSRGLFGECPHKRERRESGGLMKVAS